jgi:predicted nucleic acid-binding protein
MIGRLLDTCIVIDVLRRRDAAIRYINELTVRPTISVVTITELRAGQRSHIEARQIDHAISGYLVKDVTAMVAEQAGQYLRSFARSHALDTPDALIAGTAAHHGLALATLNLKHFPMFPHLEAPY